MSVSDLYMRIDLAATRWAELNDFLVRGTYDFERARPVLNGQSLAYFRRQVTLALELLQALRPDGEEGADHLVITARELELRGNVDIFNRQTEHMLGQLRPHWTEGASLRDQNDNFNLQLMNEAGNTIVGFDFNDQFSQLLSSVAGMLTVSGQMMPIAKGTGVADLSERAEKLGAVVRQSEQLRKQSEKHEAGASAAATRSAEHQAETKSMRTQIETLMAQIQALQQQATSDTSNVTTLVERIRTVASSAETLEQSITSYQAKFDDFQNKLSERLKDFVAFARQKEEFATANAGREKQIDLLSQQADAMIQGATTAGLAKSMEDARKRYEDRLNSTRKGFYFAIVLLIISAMPLAAHLLPGIFQRWIPGLDVNADSSPYGVIGKVLLLLPATWLTAFFTKTYAELFHTEREYAHKAALAMSVEGFKRQAPKYEEEITAEVFMEIRQNPGNGRTVEAASHPLYDVLAKTVEKVLPEKKK